MRAERRQARAASEAARDHEFEVIDSAVHGLTTAEPDDAALTNFALAVRSARPEAQAGFTVELDERIARLQTTAAGESARKPLWRRRRPQVVAFCCLAVLFAASVTITGLYENREDVVSATGGDAIELYIGRDPQSSAMDTGGLEEFTKQAQGANAQVTESLSSDRDVIRAASLSIGTGLEEFNETTDEVIAITDRLGGFVRESNVADGTADDPRGRLILLVPATKLQTALASISELGTVLERNQRLQDVTASVSRVDRRVESLRARRAVLVARLNGASTDAQRAVTRSQIRRTNERLAQAVAEQRQIQRKVRYSELNVTVEASAARDDESVIGRAWDIAKSAVETIVAVLIVALAIGLPIGILALASLLAARWWRRRTRERAIDSAAAAPGQAP